VRRHFVPNDDDEDDDDAPLTVVLDVVCMRVVVKSKSDASAQHV